MGVSLKKVEDRGFYFVLEFTLFERYKSGGSLRYDVMHLFILTKYPLV